MRFQILGLLKNDHYVTGPAAHGKRRQEEARGDKLVPTSS